MMSNDIQQTIEECEKLSHANVPFPEVLKRLSLVGIERYIADLSGRKKLYNCNNDDSYTQAMSFAGPKVALKFDARAIEASVKDIQQQKIGYEEFLQQIMAAGCCHYEVFINGKQVYYFGRDGSYHLEKFPNKI